MKARRRHQITTWALLGAVTGASLLLSGEANAETSGLRCKEDRPGSGFDVYRCDYDLRVPPRPEFKSRLGPAPGPPYSS